MNILKMVLIFTCSFCFLAERQLDPDKIQIWDTGSLHSSEMIGKSGEEWFGLYKVEGGFKLIKSKITVAESSTVGGLYNRYVSTGMSSHPLFLVRGIKGMKNGFVNSLISEPTFIYPAELRSMKFQDTYYVFKAFGSAVDKQVDIVINNYELKLSVGQQSQTIATYKWIGSDKHPQIFWAGDLDGDGKLDLVLDTATHYNLFEFTLFLSSAAKGNDLVGRVASFRKGGC